ncbi:MAG: ABC transporter substrate-binding protein [Methanomassiliicoccales archaeon]|nr:ABC transporter substrate-binding protein [Methanomassiliicoccales archaeon]
MKTNPVVSVLVVVAIAITGIAAAGCLGGNTAEKTIYWSSVAPVNQKAAIEAGVVEGGVSWEPYVSDSLVDGTANLIKWSGDIWPHHPCCVIAVTKAFANQPEVRDNDLVARVIRAHIDATNWIIQAVEEQGANYSAMLAIGAEFSNRTNAVVESAVGHIEFGYAIGDDTKAWFANYTSMFADLGQITTLGGYSNVSALVDGLVNTTYLEKALTVEPSDTILGTVRLGFLLGDLHQFARVIAMDESLWGGETLFEKYGVEITSPAPYGNGAFLMDGFGRNEIDVGYLGAPPAILKRINADIQIEIVSLANSEGSAIIAGDGITTFDDLNGKTVATPGPGSIQHLLLMFYSNEQGYTLKLKGT